MFTLLASLALSLVTYGLVALLFDPLAAIVPGTMVFMIAVVVGLMQVKKRVDEGIAGIVPLLQERRIHDAEAHLEAVRAKWAWWMPLLDGQVDAQLGMLEYYQLKFDKALPKLEKGKWRNWMALGCIGAIHFRKGRRVEAFEHLDKAVAAAPKEPMVHVLKAVLAHRSGDGDLAMAAVNKGLESLPDNKMLLDLKVRIANKKKIKTQSFGEGWVQFFPEELAAQAHIAARRGSPLPGAGFKGPSVSKQMRRGR